MKPLRNVASGGELSRIMLALKAVLAEKDEIPTVIFDEIDTGISGRTAQKVSERLKEIAKGRQVIAITHLPQIAALGENHYKVYKADTALRTETHISRLNEDERIQEIATMLSGNEVSESALKTARELVNRK